MTDALKPGRFVAFEVDDLTGWTDSMAARMDQELDALLQMDGLDPLPQQPDDREVRDRRRLFVAIARGVALHLSEHAGAFAVTVQQTSGQATVAPVIAIDDAQPVQP